MNLSPEKLAALLESVAGFSAALKIQLGLKLGKTERAADTTLFEGKTLAAVIAEAQAGVDLSQVVLKGDNFNSYKVDGKTFTALFAEIDADIAAIEALIPGKATTEEAVAGVEDTKWVTAVGVKAAATAAIDALVDGAPEALDTLKELADKLIDQDDALAALITQLGEKLGKLETAADSAKFGGQTPTQFKADALVVTKGITDPLTGRVAALEALVGDASDFLTAESDLGVNPVALPDDGETPAKSVQEHIVGINTKVAATQAAQVDIIMPAIQALQDTKLDKTGVAADSGKLGGQTLAQILASIRGGDIQTIQAVQDNLEAFIAESEAAALVKATGVEAVAGTDDAKYITALALKSATDKAIADVVGGAPEASNTLKKLADALAGQADLVSALTLVVDGKLGKTEQAADSLKLNGKTQAELSASAAEVEAGTEAGKWVTPAAVAPRLKELGDDMDALVTQMTGAFNAAAADINPA